VGLQAALFGIGEVGLVSFFMLAILPIECLRTLFQPVSCGCGKGRGGHALALDFLGANPQATLTARQRLSGEVK
jgi:hypothetical protein